MELYRVIARIVAIFCVAFLLALPTAGAEPPPSAAPENSFWFEDNGQGDAWIDLYFFRSSHCPHCANAKVFLQDLRTEQPWLRVHDHEVSENPENARFFDALAQATGNQAQYVPAIFVCGVMVTGFGTPETTGVEIRNLIEACRDHARTLLFGTGSDDKQGVAETVGSENLENENVVALPLLGSVALDTYSLPVLTVALAGIDAFNPCAFFVLLMLLSLLSHTHSQARMIVVGATFVLLSGAVYFVFMAAWLNLFLVVGRFEAITLAAGLIAVLIGGLNIKDFFWFGKAVSLGIPDAAKPKLFDRMRRLLSTSSLPILLLGTATLALVANSYELICTAGFPMIFTRALTLQDLAPPTYYLYLVLYNAVYVIPLAVIVGLYVVTLGSRKLTERQGRGMKLLSGLMMFGLGAVLLIAPDWMTNVLNAVGLIGFALAATAALMWWDGRLKRRNS